MRGRGQQQSFFLRKLIRGISTLAFVYSIVSCEPGEINPEEGNPEFHEGVLIVNEGQFLSANASISYFDTRVDSVRNHVFYRINGVPLGDVAHSIYTWNDEAYLIVNNSGKIFRTGKSDMKFREKFDGLISPRYLVVNRSISGVEKAYISDLYSGNIRVVDPYDGELLNTIAVSSGESRLSTEQMIIHDGLLYVACWSYGEQILIIDTETDRIIDSVKVGKQPNSMVIDKEKNLWVLSDGGYPFSPFGQENASLTCIELNTRNPETMKTWDDIRVSPIDLCINGTGDTLYFIAGDIYSISLDMNGFDRPLINSNGRQIYSLGVNPSTGNIYVGDAVDYQQDGWVYRYRPDGAVIDSFRVGVNPGYFYFNYPGNN
jgi:DNA-binding beta-propeller fold protein YncE